MLFSVAVVALICGCGGPVEDPNAKPWRSLCEELLDPDRIARMDLPPSSIITSYDRTGGNDDYNNYVRTGPKGWWVLADIEGPGYITRFWFTGAEKGTHRVRFYFDGEKEPRIDTTMDELCGGREQYCWYSLVPISYARKLVVMTQKGGFKEGGWPRLFYQINHTSLPKDQPVASYPKMLTASDRDLIDELRGKWESAGEQWIAKPGENVLNDLILAPGKITECKMIEGPGEISVLEIVPDFSKISAPDRREAMLRDVILQIEWDGCGEKSVEVPLGDFFGSFWRRTRFNSMYMGMSGNRFRCCFPMPFKTSAKISFKHDGVEQLPVKVVSRVRKLDEWAVRHGYFHSCWHKTGPADVGRPHPIVIASGRGKYVGCILGVTGVDQSWWILEGDETIVVDGESFPRWHGTGLEDYFNGGWYYNNVLVRPFHGLTFRVPFRAVQYRLHPNDPQSFEKSIAMQFERGPGQASKGWMESVAYYYMATPVAAASSLGKRNERSLPVDQFAAVTILSEIINHERLGDYEGALGLTLDFLARNPEMPQGELLRLRAIAYEEKLHGFDAVKKKYEDFVADSTNEAAIAEAKLLLWFHESPNNALLGAYCNAGTDIVIDGKLAMKVDHPERLIVKPVNLAAGDHIMSVRAQWRRRVPWIQVCLRTHSGDFVSRPDWKWARNPIGAWASRDFDDSRWEEFGHPGLNGPPQIPYVKLMPNAFVGMQANAIGIQVPEWDQRRDTIGFRTLFRLQGPDVPGK